MPHPIPYQGSKRALAPRILATVAGQNFRTLHEPFAGSAAFTLAAARAQLAADFRLADSLEPLVQLWRAILDAPEMIADRYEALWKGQRLEDEEYFFAVRDAFNQSGDPARLLYLLARCVKNSPRFNREGRFNQSPDKRRLGMRPDKMRREVTGTAALLQGRATVEHADFEQSVHSVGSEDLVYLDPPWQGTSDGPDKRYHQGLRRERLLWVLEALNQRGVSYLLSYDGRCGERTYGEPLPSDLQLTHLQLDGGRSSQATLAGRADRTVESLYLSPSLVRRADIRLRVYGRNSH